MRIGASGKPLNKLDNLTMFLKITPKKAFPEFARHLEQNALTHCFH